MGETRLTLVVGFGVCCLGSAAAIPPTPARAAQARFMSFSTEAQCVSAHAIAPAVCASAFERAKSAFEAKTTAYPTLAACAKVYGSCAAWPSATPRGARPSFRPLFEGVDIVDTPGEQSVTPSSPVKQLRFAALPLEGPTAPPRELTVRAPHPAAGRGATPGHALAIPPDAGAAAPGRAEPPPPPGAGFKVIDGVLTYPAPERFQPKNLPKPPQP